MAPIGKGKRQLLQCLSCVMVGSTCSRLASSKPCLMQHWLQHWGNLANLSWGLVSRTLPFPPKWYLFIYLDVNTFKYLFSSLKLWDTSLKISLKGSVDFFSELWKIFITKWISDALDLIRFDAPVSYRVSKLEFMVPSEGQKWHH